MNLYFLVEGSTESDFYPSFVDFYFENKIIRVDKPLDAASNNYYLIGSGGYPFIYTGSKYPKDSDAALKNAILDVNRNPVFDYLVICLDADELSIEERIIEFENHVDKLKKEKIILNSYCEFKLIIQNRCIETWFLGNKKILKKNPNTEPLISYINYYNVKDDDPELMGNFNDSFTHQDFHHQYLRATLRERRLFYNKAYIANTIVQKDYIEQLVKRINERKKHLKTLSDFFYFCQYIKNKLV